MSAVPVPTFYFGVMSPYSWFAAERIYRLLPQARWRGVLAGVVFKQHGRTSWGLTEERAQGIADCEQRAAEHGLGPGVWPQPWPTSDLRAARALAFCQGLDAAASASGVQLPGGRGLLQQFAL